MHGAASGIPALEHFASLTHTRRDLRSCVDDEWLDLTLGEFLDDKGGCQDPVVSSCAHDEGDKRSFCIPASENG